MPTQTTITTGLAPDLRPKRVALSALPVIDLSPMRSGMGKNALAREIRDALVNIGFMYVKGHGVSPGLVTRAYEVSRQFFELPQAQKDALGIAQSGVALHGYTGFFQENTDPEKTRDFKEIFDLGRPAADGRVRPFFGPTPWPASLPAFREVMERYHDEMLRLAHHLMAAIALSLDLPEDYFASMMQEPIGIQRLLHYPPQDQVADERLIGIGAHTDYGCLTILSQDKVGGLQVLNRDREWIDAPPLPDTFIVNIGDMLQRLTNGLYLANLHRVINISGQERYSIPCFFDVDYDTVFAPLTQFTGPANPARYEPIVCGAHKWARYVAAYPHLRAHAGSSS